MQTAAPVCRQLPLRLKVGYAIRAVQTRQPLSASALLQIAASMQCSSRAAVLAAVMLLCGALAVVAQEPVQVSSLQKSS
jgi:hypothetical protein